MVELARVFPFYQIIGEYKFSQKNVGYFQMLEFAHYVLAFALPSLFSLNDNNKALFIFKQLFMTNLAEIKYIIEYTPFILFNW